MREHLGDRARRIALAVSRAVVPACDDGIVDRVEAFLGAFGPGTVRGYGAVLELAEQTARVSTWGKPFSALSPAEGERVLHAWADADVARAGLALAVTSPIKGAYFDDPAIYKKLDSVFVFESKPESPPWMKRVTDGAMLDADADLEADVVIVGTGAGGAVVGKELAARGHAVLFLEEGKYHGRHDFRGRSFEAFHRFYRDHATTGAIGSTFIPIPMGRMVGGSTAINTGTCWRTPRRILHHWVHDLGLRELSEANLEPYFEKVERELEIGPTDLVHLGGVARVIARGCDALGYSHLPLKRNAPGCDGSGICDAGCPTGARRSMEVSYVPAALRSGAELYTSVRASRVIVEGDRVTGIEARSSSGRRVRVRAKATIVAGGAIPSPMLLQRSAIKLRHVGKNLSIHPATTVSAMFEESIRGFAAVPQGYCVNEKHDRGILLLGASAPIDLGALQLAFVGEKLASIMDRYDRVASFGVMVEDESRGTVREGPLGRPLVTYSLGEEERTRLIEGTAMLARIFFAGGATEVWPAIRGHRVMRSEHDVARMIEARPAAIDFLLTAFHPLGTCRMATTAKHGVVDQDHAVFGLRGLFVVDGSAVPSSVAVNPQETIMALATRAAERVERRVLA